MLNALGATCSTSGASAAPNLSRVRRELYQRRVCDVLCLEAALVHTRRLCGLSFPQLSCKLHIKMVGRINGVLARPRQSLQLQHLMQQLALDGLKRGRC